MALLASPAAAQISDATHKDLRCLAAMSALAGSETPELKQAGTLGAMLWYGRLSATMSEAQITDAMIAEVKTMATADLTSETQRCGTEMQAYGQAMQRIGNSLAKAGN